MVSTSQTYLFNRFFAIVLLFDAAKIIKTCAKTRHRSEKIAPPPTFANEIGVFADSSR